MSMYIFLDNEPFRMGRIVHFIDDMGHQHPMLLTSCHKSGINGLHHASGVVFDWDNRPCTLQVNVSYDSKKTPMTWHWPSQMVRKKKLAINKPIFDLKKVAKAATK